MITAEGRDEKRVVGKSTVAHARNTRSEVELVLGEEGGKLMRRIENGAMCRNGEVYCVQGKES